MSDSNGPVRRRRIAGEASPAAPAQPPVVKKAPSKKAAARKAAAAEKAAATTPASPTSKTSPTSKKAAADTVVKAKAAPAKKAPAPAAKKATAPAAKPSVATPAGRRPTVSKPIAPVAVPRTSASDHDVREPQAARPVGARPSRRELLWLVPATLVAVASLVVGVFLVAQHPGSGPGGAELGTSQRQASSAAASASEAIFSFRYDQLDQHLTASKALMTPAFGKEFDTIAPALTELAPQRKIVVQAVARDAAALPCGNDCSTTEADVLVFVDQARLVGDDTEPSVFANRIKVSMVKGDDGWLVSDIRAL